MLKTKRALPFFILLAVILLFYLTNLHEFSFGKISQEQAKIVAFAKAHPYLTPPLFIGFYILSVCLIIPDSMILTLLSGLIFPLPLAIFYSVFSETAGACLFFLIFQKLFSKVPLSSEKNFLKKMRRQLALYPTSYMLFLRLSHIIPFWLINVFSAYFKVRYWTFTWTTFLGVIPLTAVLANAGHSLAKHPALNLAEIFTTSVKFALLFLGLLALLPIFYNKLFKKHS